MADRMQGIVRYAREILSELDKLLTDDISVSLIIPPNAHDVPNYQNIRVISIGKRTGILWEQLDLGKYARKHKEAILINFCNVVPFFVQPGITVVHDIMYKVRPEFYSSFRNKLSRLWHVLQYQYVFSHEKSIITVSEFSKSEIEKYYPKTKGKITVIPNGWQHVLRFQENPDWQKKYPFLEEKNYFFSLATLSKNKNGKWIIEAAKRNPDMIFAMAGKHYETEYESISENVHMLGFISDEDACSLIKHCRAFIFPSLYEGFGLPPLEALALGADVIVSNTTSLPEVLGNSVRYINPENPNVDFDDLLQQNVESKISILDKYSWKKSAKIFLDII